MELIDDILDRCKTVAVVGLSPRADRESYGVAQYLQEQGLRIIPVNPKVDEVLGEKAYPDLSSIPISVDVVDIFRKSAAAVPIIESAIEIGAWAVWMQKGVVNEEGAAKARAAGLKVVMDECMECEVRARREASS